MPCQQSDYTLTLAARMPEQSLSFELQPTITVTFVPPSGHSIVSVDYQPNPAPRPSPEPTLGPDSITFSRPPASASTDFFVEVRYKPDDGGSQLPSVPIVFKPRRDCPP